MNKVTETDVRIRHYIECEGDALVAGFGHQSLMHCSLGGFVVCWGVQLYVLEPDVFSEGQANHIQVITPVAESTGKLNPSCIGAKTQHSLLSC